MNPPMSAAMRMNIPKAPKLTKPSMIQANTPSR